MFFLFVCLYPDPCRPGKLAVACAVFVYEACPLACHYQFHVFKFVCAPPGCIIPEALASVWLYLDSEVLG